MSESDDQYSPEETAERFARSLKRLLNMPPSAQKPLKQRKRGRPRKRKLKPPRISNDL